MNRRLVICLCVGSSIALFVLYNYHKEQKPFAVASLTVEDQHLHIALISCGQNLTAVPQNTLTLIKSILLHRPQAVFHIFTDEMDEVQAKLADFARTNGLDMANFHDQFQIRSIQLPSIWRSKQFEHGKHCIAQTLFMAESLPTSIERVIKLDTDVIVMSDIQNLFSHFEKFNETQMMGAVSDGSEIALYDIFRKGPPFPLYKPYLNSGVLLMHLGRIRAMNFTQVVTDILEQYLPLLKMPDQDILNIFFSDRRELMYLLPCNYNFRSEHCLLKRERCQPALEEARRNPECSFQPGVQVTEYPNKKLCTKENVTTVGVDV